MYSPNKFCCLNGMYIVVALVLSVFHVLLFSTMHACRMYLHRRRRYVYTYSISTVSDLSSSVVLNHACLQDVSQQEEEGLFLEVIVYIGLGVSIISLTVTVITYTSSR